MKKPRDDFSAAVKRSLAERVAWHCSNTDCGVHTTGPHSDGERSVNIGVAAHITAAAPGGPRYDATLTAEERSSIANGIWLCQTHSKLVDSDESKYTVGEIRKWKEETEYAVSVEVMGGHPFASPRARPGATTPLPRLLAEYRQRMVTDPELRTYIEQLQHWLGPAQTEVTRGLDEKLTSAKRADEVGRALRLKERFAKQLAKHQFSEVAQKIFAHVLAELESRYHRGVYSHIAGGLGRASVDERVSIEVLAPVMAELGSGNELITKSDLEGMLYFLTGNCHIEWS